MPHALVVTTDGDYSGTLALGKHPDGELAFEDGTAVVEREETARRLADHYPNLAYDGAADADGAADETADDDAKASVAEPPLNPDEFAVGALRDALADADYSAAELNAIEQAERADGSPRSTAIDAIDAARED